MTCDLLDFLSDDDVAWALRCGLLESHDRNPRSTDSNQLKIGYVPSEITRSAIALNYVLQRSAKAKPNKSIHDDIDMSYSLSEYPSIMTNIVSYMPENSQTQYSSDPAKMREIVSELYDQILGHVCDRSHKQK